MGSSLASLFGGGYSAPEPPKSEPIPIREEAAEPVSKAAREEERRKLRARRSMSGTLLTSPLGASGASQAGASGLLGKSI